MLRFNLTVWAVIFYSSSFISVTNSGLYRNVVSLRSYPSSSANLKIAQIMNFYMSFFLLVFPFYISFFKPIFLYNDFKYLFFYITISNTYTPDTPKYVRW